MGTHKKENFWEEAEWVKYCSLSILNGIREIEKKKRGKAGRGEPGEQQLLEPWLTHLAGEKIQKKRRRGT